MRNRPKTWIFNRADLTPVELEDELTNEQITRIEQGGVIIMNVDGTTIRYYLDSGVIVKESKK